MENNRSFLDQKILAIESSDYHVMKERSVNETFELTLNPDLLADLSGGMGTYIVRAFLKELGIDERQVLQWRLENKYVQYLVIDYYIPNSMAVTFSLSMLLAVSNGIEKVKDLCANGFFLKSTLGDSSGRSNRFDRTNELMEIISAYEEKYYEEEQWILQEKLHLVEEFRIHTFGRDLIYGLSFRINGNSSDGSGAQEFVKSILQKLPETILQGLIGWDIGITKDHQIYIIEANFTGFHQEYGRGFQTSGYFGDAQFGPIVCAWLNNYFKVKHNISIGSVEKSLVLEYAFFQEFMFYTSVLKSDHLNIFSRKLDGAYVAAVIYMGDQINSLLIKLIKYFQMINLADRYFVIVNETIAKNLKSLFADNHAVKVFIEQQLLSEEQVLLLKEDDFISRKDTSCREAVKLIAEEVYVIM